MRVVNLNPAGLHLLRSKRISNDLIDPEKKNNVILSDLEELIKRCEVAKFRKRDELIGGIRSGELNLTDSPSLDAVPVEQLLTIYESRAEHLKQFQTEHSERLRSDVLELINNLRIAVDGRVAFWGFKKDPNISFEVFETSDRSEILGWTNG